MNNGKIFISHSSKDIKVIEAFVNHILRLGLDISADRIFCTSMEGHGVKSGQYIPDRLREEISKASIALLFISKNYKTSEVCLNEVGAAWVSLPKENVIPLLLPDIDFDKLGFLDFGRLGLKAYESTGLLKLIGDQKKELNPDFHLDKLTHQIETFLDYIKQFYPSQQNKKTELSEESLEWKRCFEDTLYPFDDIIRQAIPAHDDGIYEIPNVALQSKIMHNMSNAKFLDNLWYKKAEGDFYVQKIIRLPSGNWMISEFNWEIKISSMWVSKYTELQYEFILIHSEAMQPFKIDSDVGGESYNVGILNDGTIVSENERLNGYAIINSETVDLYKHGVQHRRRDSKSHWIFFVSDYHKAGNNPDETIEFCGELDNGAVEVNAENIYNFLWRLRNHPTVLRWR